MRPIGVGRASKDNSNKHPHKAEEFKEGKKIGRIKQVWVPSAEPTLMGEPKGRWEKVRG